MVWAVVTSDAVGAEPHQWWWVSLLVIHPHAPTHYVSITNHYFQASLHLANILAILGTNCDSDHFSNHPYEK